MGDVRIHRYTQDMFWLWIRYKRSRKLSGKLFEGTSPVSRRIYPEHEVDSGCTDPQVHPWCFWTTDNWLAMSALKYMMNATRLGSYDFNYSRLYLRIMTVTCASKPLRMVDVFEKLWIFREKTDKTYFWLFPGFSCSRSWRLQNFSPGTHLANLGAFSPKLKFQLGPKDMKICAYIKDFVASKIYGTLVLRKMGLECDFFGQMIVRFLGRRHAG